MAVTTQTTDSIESENKIQAMREARRKKILENAKERLEKISKTVKDDKIRIPTQPPIFADPEMETEELFGPESLFAQEKENNKKGENIMGQSPFLDEAFLASLRKNNDGNKNNQGMKTNAFFVHKIHLMLLSILTYILFVIDQQFLVSSNIFLPFLVWELSETLISRRFENETNSLLSIVFALGGITPAKSKKIIKIMSIFNKIFDDLGIFMFFFVLSHIIKLGFQF